MITLEQSKQLSAAGISPEEQQRYFAGRVEFTIAQGIITLYTTDFVADLIQRKFYDCLCKAYGNNWQIIGTKGNRDPKESPDNPKWGPATHARNKSQAEVIQGLYEKLAEYERWVTENKDKIINWGVIEFCRGQAKRIIAYEEGKLITRGEAA